MFAKKAKQLKYNQYEKHGQKLVLLTVLDSLRKHGFKRELYNSNEATQICPNH